MMNWTDERVELLKKLWAAGLSASQIAGELGGITRNAVIGKVHRLGLSGRAKTASSAAPRPRKPRAPSHPASMFRVQGNTALQPSRLPDLDIEPLIEREVRPLLEPVSSERVTIMDLREAMCRWPLGDPGAEDFRFCGSRANSCSSYCSYHAQLAYQPASDRRRRTAAA
jgi:GcrA cell cycle regulator